MRQMRLSLEPLTHAAGVDVFLYGHVHAYERSTPVSNYTADACGAVHLTIGDAGNSEGLSFLNNFRERKLSARPPLPPYPNPTSPRARPPPRRAAPRPGPLAWSKRPGAGGAAGRPCLLTGQASLREPGAVYDRVEGTAGVFATPPLASWLGRLAGRRLLRGWYCSRNLSSDEHFMSPPQLAARPPASAARRFPACRTAAATGGRALPGAQSSRTRRAAAPT